jgi:hypothetical protein
MNADCWRTVPLIDAQNIDERTCSLLISCYRDALVEPMVSGDYSSAIIHAIQAHLGNVGYNVKEAAHTSQIEYTGCDE